MALSQNAKELLKLGAGKFKIGDNGKFDNLMNLIELCSKNYSPKLPKTNFVEVLLKINQSFNKFKYTVNRTMPDFCFENFLKKIHEKVISNKILIN